MKRILYLEGVSMVFGGLRAADRVNIEIFEGEIAALIGPNGAGKTTLFNCITGVYVPTEGSIYLSRDDYYDIRISGMKPHVINEKGLARTFQNIRLFSNMTVLENVLIGRHQHLKSGLFSSILRTAANREEEARAEEDALAILAKMDLDRYANELARNLPYGAQRRLEIARALATEPVLLLLDEPAAGMNPHETRELEETIRFIRDNEKITILLIEHDMSLVMNISERIYVVDYGKIIAEGSPQEIKNNPEVIRAYLGE
ncbi:MAG: ABC transporter ATP-binding protein [Spirochaetales bacterium]|nr:ABC transporter ATP-binding protein [Spirochaetales bacterium]